MRLGKVSILSNFELDRRLEFHWVDLIVKNPTLNFIRVIIIFEKGSSFNLELLFFITWRHIKLVLVNTFYDLLLRKDQAILELAVLGWFFLEFRIGVLVFGFQINQKRVEIKREVKQLRKNVAVDVHAMEFDENSTTFFQDAKVHLGVAVAENFAQFYQTLKILKVLDLILFNLVAGVVHEFFTTVFLLFWQLN
jgi:hypothetical protein